jgi:EAL domain-containing protein (putative c-di-GMP-specific phosphodiesterase class I)
VLNRALDDYLRWTALGMTWKLSVNVSARNLDSMDFVSEVCDGLSQRGIDASALLLEVTETALAADADMAMAVVNALAMRGVGTSIDDFGVGYTSLSQMRDLTVAEVKIDRAFVKDLAEHTRDRSIVSAMIDLGHRLGCQVTAEGVEDQAVATWLSDAGCDQAQGYLWSRPRAWPELVARADAQPTGAGLTATHTPSSTTTEGALT